MFSTYINSDDLPLVSSDDEEDSTNCFKYSTVGPAGKVASADPAARDYFDEGLDAVISSDESEDGYDSTTGSISDVIKHKSNHLVSGYISSNYCNSVSFPIDIKIVINNFFIHSSVFEEINAINFPANDDDAKGLQQIIYFNRRKSEIINHIFNALCPTNNTEQLRLSLVHLIDGKTEFDCSVLEIMFKFSSFDNVLKSKEYNQNLVKCCLMYRIYTLLYRLIAENDMYHQTMKLLLEHSADWRIKNERNPIYPYAFTYNEEMQKFLKTNKNKLSFKRDPMRKLLFGKAYDAFYSKNDDNTMSIYSYLCHKIDFESFRRGHIFGGDDFDSSTSTVMTLRWLREELIFIINDKENGEEIDKNIVNDLEKITKKICLFLEEIKCRKYGMPGFITATETIELLDLMIFKIRIPIESSLCLNVISCALIREDEFNLFGLKLLQDHIPKLSPKELVHFFDAKLGLLEINIRIYNGNLDNSQISLQIITEIFWYTNTMINDKVIKESDMKKFIRFYGRMKKTKRIIPILQSLSKDAENYSAKMR